jgi:hypothetical protein
MKFHRTRPRFATAIFHKLEHLRRRLVRTTLISQPTKPAIAGDKLQDIEKAIERCRLESDAASADVMLNRATLHLGQRAIRMR